MMVCNTPTGVNPELKVKRSIHLFRSRDAGKYSFLFVVGVECGDSLKQLGEVHERKFLPPESFSQEIPRLLFPGSFHFMLLIGMTIVLSVDQYPIELGAGYESMFYKATTEARSPSCLARGIE